MRFVPIVRLPEVAFLPGSSGFAGHAGWKRGRFKESPGLRNPKTFSLFHRHQVVETTATNSLRTSSRRAALRPRQWALFAAALAVFWSGMVPALEPKGREAVPPIREVEPELYYLQDDAGGLVPVPGFRYRDFVDLIRLREGLPGLPELPGAVLEQLRVEVTMPEAAAGSRATAAVRVEAVLRQTRPGWVMLPLKLSELVIAAAPETTGTGQVIVTVDQSLTAQASLDDEAAVVAGGLSAGPRQPGATGFLVWLNGREAAGDTATPPDAEAEWGRHTLVLRGQIPVDRAEHRDLFMLTLPAAASSELTIVSSRTQPEVSLDPRALVPVVKPRAGDGESGSEVTVAGLVGPTRIRLADRAVAVAAAEQVPEVSADTEVRIDGRIARIDTVLRLASIPDALRQVTISLPPRVTLQAVGRQGSLIQQRGSPDARQVLVRLDDVRDGVAEIELSCERVINASGGTPFDAGGFAVSGVPAWRQWGRTSVFTDTNWQVDWEPRAGNRRVDAPAASQQAGFVAAFAYDAQPASLPLRVRPRSSRTVIEPEYRYHVSAHRLELDVRLRAAIRGVPAERVALSLPGWDVEEVGPAGVVDAAAVSVEDGEIVIPFFQPLVGDVVVELRCSQVVDRSHDTIHWTTPVPQADLVGPGNVVITSDTDIELVPDNELIEGMSRQVATSLDRAGGDLLRMAYRVEATEAIFAATRRFLSRQIDASVAAQVDVSATALSVNQVVRLDVAHVPLEFVQWHLPAAMLDSGSLEIRQSGELLTPEVFTAADSAAEALSPVAHLSDGEPVAQPRETRDGPRKTVRVVLSEPLLGVGELVVRYRQLLPEIPEETTVAVSVPLLIPEDAAIGRETVTLAETGGFAIDVRDDRWSREGNLQAIGLGRTWNASEPCTVIDVALSRQEEDVERAAVVEAAWVRTTVRSGVRIDRWAYAITSSSERLTLLVPTATATATAPAVPEASRRSAGRVRVDGGAWQEVLDASGRFDVELLQGGTHLLEVEVRQPRLRPTLAGVLPLPDGVLFQRPALPTGTIYRQIAWEVVPPTEQALFAGPRGWTSQQAWGWTRYGFQPVPRLSAADLADWVAAAVSDETHLTADGPASPDRAAEQRLVFWDVGGPAAVRVWFVPWWLLVFTASGLPLVGGLLISMRWSLGRWLFMALAGGFVIGMAIVPLTTVLVTQASLPGLLLAALAAVVTWWRTLVDGRFVRAGEPVSWFDHRPDSVTRAGGDASLVINVPSAKVNESGDVTQSAVTS